MFGITNAQGIAGPDLEARLNAYYQGTITPLYNELSAKIGRLEKNPPVGSVTLFGGFEWLVVHWDTETEEPFMVLAMKDIYSLTAFAEDDGASDLSALSYADSKLYATLVDFERNEFIGSSNSDAPFRVSVYEAARSLIKDSETDHYAFIPTRRQLMEYALFQSDETTSSARATANAAACYHGEPKFWWTSSFERMGDGENQLFAFYVYTNGALGLGVNGDALFTAELGFRPFIRMKMR